MQSGQRRDVPPGHENLSAVVRQSKLVPEHTGRRRGAESDDNFRAHDFHLPFEPGRARESLGPGRFGVEPSPAAGLPLEVLHRVRDVYIHLQFCLGDRRTQEFARRPHEGTSFEVLLIAWLFSDEHHPRPREAFTEDALRRIGIERTPPAAINSGPQGCQVIRRRDVREGGFVTRHTPSNAYAVGNPGS